MGLVMSLWACIVHAKLRQDRAQELGLSHRYGARLVITLKSHDETVLELAKIEHLEALTQCMLLSSQAYYVVAREDKIVVVKSHKHRGSTFTLDVHAVIHLALVDSDLAHKVVDGLIPHA